jgi:hypothetical protein
LGRAYDPLTPLTFLDDLYCVGPGSSSGSDSVRALSGAAATAVGCPDTPDISSFVADNPALFEATGLSEHPYSLSGAPNTPYTYGSESDFVPLASLNKLESAIDAAFSAYGETRQLPLYLTEYGYVTNPPNPHYVITPTQQGIYLDQAEYMAAQDPRVRALSQFELQDSNPAQQCGCKPGNPRYWDNFEEGIEFLGGTPKASYAAYRLPIFLPQLEDPDHVAKAGEAVRVWGMLRPAANNTTQTARIQWSSTANGSYRTIATVTTRDPSGIVSENVPLPGSGDVRLAWTAPNGSTLYSRDVAVTVSPAG